MNKTKRYGKKIDEALDLWVKLLRTHDTLYPISGEFIRAYGLTPMQFSVIECLGHLGPMLMGDLTKKQLTTGGNITVVVDNLVKLGFVKRVPSKEDGRAYYVQLTPKGKKFFNKTFKQYAKFIASLVSVLSESEQKQLSNLLKKLGTSVAKNYSLQQN